MAPNQLQNADLYGALAAPSAEPTARGIRVVFGGEIVAESKRALLT